MGKIIIAGASSAGIKVAQELLKSKKDCTVTILEAEKEISTGGRNFREVSEGEIFTRVYYSDGFYLHTLKKERKGILSFFTEFFERFKKCEEAFYYREEVKGQTTDFQSELEEVKKLGAVVMTDCRVKKLVRQDGRIIGVQYIQNNKARVMECDALVVTVPLKDALDGLSGVESEAREWAEGLKYYDGVTVEICINKKQLSTREVKKDLEKVGRIYIRNDGFKSWKLEVVNNFPGYVDDGLMMVRVLLYYVVGENEFTDGEMIQIATDELIRIGMIKDEEAALDARCERNKRAYPDCQNEKAQDIREYLEKIPNLYLAGRMSEHRCTSATSEAVWNKKKIIDNI